MAQSVPVTSWNYGVQLNFVIIEKDATKKKMKKITHIIFSLKLGGTESMLVDIVNKQVKKHNVTVIIIHNIIDSELVTMFSAQVELICLKQKPPTVIPWFFFKLLWVMLKAKPDIVHLHSSTTLKLFPTAVRLFFPNVSFRFTAHTTGIMLGKEISNIDRFFAISEAVKNDITKRYKYKNIEVVHNGINCKQFFKRDNFSIPKTFKIVQIGRLVHNIKGQDILLEALARINNLPFDLQIEVYFIGVGSSNSFLEDLVHTLGIEKKVSFLGIKSKNWIYNNLKNFHLLLQPSRIEGFGLTIIEGMTAKIPVLVSDIEGPMEVIQGGRYGYAFKAGNSDECAIAIKKVISDYKCGVIEHLIEDAFRYAEKNFDIKKTAKFYAQM